MSQFWHRLGKGGFITNVLVLVGGTAFSQALLFLASPLITRLYTPDDFGAWSLILSLSSVFSVVASWRYELAIVLPKKIKEAANLLIGSVLIAIAMSGFQLVIVSLFGRQITKLLGIEKLLPWLWVMPLMLLLIGLYNTFNYWSTRKQQFRLLAISNISKSLALVSTQVGAALLMGTSSSGLIMGTVIGQIAATGVLGVVIWQEDGSYLIKSSSWQTIRDSIYKYRNFPLYVAPYSFIGSLHKQTLLLLLGTYATTRVVGLYALAVKIVEMPISLIASALNQAFFPKAAKQLESGNLENFVLKALTLLVVVTTPIFAFFIFNAEFLFRTVFGEAWADASIYGVWLALPAFMFLYTSWFDRIYDILGRQQLALSMEILYDILSICLFSISLVWMQKPELAVSIYSVVAVSYNFVWLAVTFHLAKFSLRGIWQVSKIFISVFFIATSVHWIAKLLFSEVETIVTDVLMMAVYYGFLGIIYSKKQQK